MMSPELQRLSRKYAERLVVDPLFSAKVKTTYRVLQKFAPDRDAFEVKATAYMLTCILEELNGQN